MRSRALREKVWAMIHVEHTPGGLTCGTPCDICARWPAYICARDLKICTRCDDERYNAGQLPYDKQFIINFKSELAQAYINDMRELIYLSIRNNYPEQDVDLDQSCMLCHKESAFVYIETSHEQVLCLKCVEKARRLRDMNLARHQVVSHYNCGNGDVNRFIRWLLVQLIDVNSIDM